MENNRTYVATVILYNPVEQITDNIYAGNDRSIALDVIENFDINDHDKYPHYAEFEMEFTIQTWENGKLIYTDKFWSK